MIAGIYAFLLFAAVQPSTESIQRLDTNRDGRVSLEEFYPTGPAPLHPRMKQVFESLAKESPPTLSYEDTAKAIKTVSSTLPKFAPDVTVDSSLVALEVHPRTKRAFIKAQINGVVGVFLLDTGTSDTILHPEFAKQAGVDFVEICMPITGGNMGKVGDFVSLVRVPDLVVEGTHFRNFHAVLRPPKSTTYEFGNSIDGVLGANLIFAKPITLDFRNRSLTFAPPTPAKDATELPLRKGEKTATVEADIDGVKVPLMLDSGAAITDAVLINEPYHDAIRKVAGDPKAGVYTATSVRVAGQVIDTDVFCLLRPFERSVLGSAFFDQHVVTVDIAAGKALIKRNP